MRTPCSPETWVVEYGRAAPGRPGGDLPELVAALAARFAAMPIDDGSRYSVRRLAVAWLLEVVSVHARAAHLRDHDTYLGWCPGTS